MNSDVSVRLYSNYEDVFWQPHLKHTQSKSGYICFYLCIYLLILFMFLTALITLNCKIYDLRL